MDGIDVLIIVVIVAAIAIFLYNKFKDKKKYEGIRAQAQHANMAQPAGTAQPVKKSHCSFCGAELSENAPFCERCGHSVNDQQL